MSMTDEVVITIERTGGFTGIPVRRSLTSGSLSSADQATLQRLLEQSHFFDCPSSDAARQPDRFLYTVTVISPTQTHTARLSEGSMPEGVRALVEWVMGKAH
jgi:hypothetical protein